MQNIIAEQKLRTQRILGGLLKRGKDTGEVRRPADNQYSATTAKEVADFRLNYKQSSTFQQIASIPEETFEEFIKEKKSAVNE